jgi:hypothetical protein
MGDNIKMDPTNKVGGVAWSHPAQNRDESQAANTVINDYIA